MGKCKTPQAVLVHIMHFYSAYLYACSNLPRHISGKNGICDVRVAAWHKWCPVYSQASLEDERQQSLNLKIWPLFIYK